MSGTAGNAPRNGSDEDSNLPRPAAIRNAWLPLPGRHHLATKGHWTPRWYLLHVGTRDTCMQARVPAAECL